MLLQLYFSSLVLASPRQGAWDNLWTHRERLKVKLLGLDSGTQVIILQGLSTYTALASAYFFARPVLRGHTVQSHRDILSGLETNDPAIKKLIKDANYKLTRRAQLDHPLAKRNNWWGLVMLVVSLVLLTGAVTLQILTDPSFGNQPHTDTPPQKNIRYPMNGLSVERG